MTTVPQQTVEERLSQLETRVAELQSALQVLRPPTKDWRKTIGAFTDDIGMQAILEDAIQLREDDRRKARTKKPTKRGR
jgi:hypothetical protein